MLLYVLLFSDGQSTSTGSGGNGGDESTSSGSSSSGGGDSHVYPGIIAAILLVFIIVIIVIAGIIIIVIKKKKSISRSQQTATVAVNPPPQASVILYTNALASSRAPASNQSYPNLVYAQQQTLQASRGNEAVLTSVNPQPFAYYPHYHGAGHAPTVGFSSNQSVVPVGNKPETDPPPYSVCTGEGAPDGSTNNRSNLLPPDYASASASAQVPPATNS